MISSTVPCFRSIFWWWDLHWREVRLYIFADIWLKIRCFSFFRTASNSTRRGGCDIKFRYRRFSSGLQFSRRFLVFFLPEFEFLFFFFIKSIFFCLDNCFTFNLFQKLLLFINLYHLNVITFGLVWGTRLLQLWPENTKLFLIDTFYRR